jgi:hypothetical protein
VYPQKEYSMSKIAYFVAGLLTGAVALGAAAFAFDDTASLPEDSDADGEEDAATKEKTSPATDAATPDSLAPENPAQA